MSRFCLDTSALLTLRDNEPGADRVAQLLEAPVRCVACFMTRMEVLDRVWKDEGERAGRLANEQLPPVSGKLSPHLISTSGGLRT